MWRSFKFTSFLGHGLLSDNGGSKKEHRTSEGSQNIFFIAARIDEGITLIKKKHSFPLTRPEFKEFKYLRGSSFFLESLELLIEKMLVAPKKGLFISLVLILVFSLFPSMILVELPLILSLSWGPDSSLYLTIDTVFKVLWFYVLIKTLSKISPFKMVFSSFAAHAGLSKSINRLGFLTSVFVMTFILSNHLLYSVGEALPLGLREVYIGMWRLLLCLGVASALYEVLLLQNKIFTRFAGIFQSALTPVPDTDSWEIAQIEAFALNELKRYNIKNKNVSNDSCCFIKVSDKSELHSNNNDWKKFLEQ